MKSPLATYKQIAKNYNITDDKNAPVAARLHFAREQQNQMQQIINRLLFDLATTTIRKDNAKDEETKTAYQDLISKYAKDLRQTRDGVEVTNELVKELEAELQPEQ